MNRFIKIKLKKELYNDLVSLKKLLYSKKNQELGVYFLSPFSVLKLSFQEGIVDENLLFSYLEPFDINLKRLYMNIFKHNEKDSAIQEMQKEKEKLELELERLKKEEKSKNEKLAEEGREYIKSIYDIAEPSIASTASAEEINENLKKIEEDKEKLSNIIQEDRVVDLIDAIKDMVSSMQSILAYDYKSIAKLLKGLIKKYIKDSTHLLGKIREEKGIEEQGYKSQMEKLKVSQAPKTVQLIQKIYLIVLREIYLQLEKYFDPSTFPFYSRVTKEIKNVEREIQLLEELLGSINGIPKKQFECKILNMRFLESILTRDPSEKYHTFQIPKTRGGVRIITAPDDSLKEKQKTLLKLLYTACPVRKDIIHGFLPKRSIFTNASVHKDARILVRVDIKEAFTSTTPRMIYRALRKYFPREIAEKIIDMVTTEIRFRVGVTRRCLPQGAPTSGFILNLCLSEFDSYINKICKRTGFRYSRYADDLVFTDDPSKETHISIKNLLQLVSEGLKKFGYRINKEKIRVRKIGRRNFTVTGCSLQSGKPTISRKIRRKIRAMVHNWITGRRSEPIEKISGYLAYIKPLHPNEYKKYSELLKEHGY